ncbi:MAG: adenosylcobinamide-GDP ribazoletransferase [Anaerolineae bacterium]
MLNDLLRAMSLLTVLPARPRWEDAAPLGRAMAWYPLVGLLLGGLLALLAHLLSVLAGTPTATALLRAALVLAAWAGLTGLLHLDGWGDCCDGLLSTVPRERRLEILKDPRVGSFALAGVVLLLLVKLAALQAVLAQGEGWRAYLPLGIAPALGRLAVVWAAWRWPSARPGGMGDLFRQGLGPAQLVPATLTALIVAALGGWAGALAVLAAVLTTLGLARLASSRLGGLTGDVYGAIVEGVETAALVALALAGGTAL